MSYDVGLYFRHEVFPLEQWKDVMAVFHARELEVIHSDYNRNVLLEWEINRNPGHLWMELRDVRDDRYFKPISALWMVFLSRGLLGASPYDVWLQFAVPYYAMTLMNNWIFYDGQDGVCVEDAHEYIELIKPKLHEAGSSLMFELGLIDAHGEPIF